VIHLHTGLPGAGKTLCTLVEVKARAEREARPVYYSGISDLKLPWIELEKGEDWHTLPSGSIVVIDEAQRVFRPRHTGSAVPVHVSKLETHRHLGLDLYIVTQHPKLLDANVRRLVGQHVHFVRAFGANMVTRHQWGEVKDDPQSRDDSIKALVPYPKEAFTWYKSAEVHTHKRRVPWRVWSLVAIPVVIAGLTWVAVQSFGRWFESDRITGSPLVGGDSPSGQRPSRERSISADGVPSITNGDWLLQRKPRVPGLVHTAPVYDAVTQPVRAPFPAVCVASAARCVCYSQQATRLGIEDGLCRRIAADGFFREFDDVPQKVERAEGYGAPVAPHEDPGLRLEEAAIAQEGLEQRSLGAVEDRASARGIANRNRRQRQPRAL